MSCGTEALKVNLMVFCTSICVSESCGNIYQLIWQHPTHTTYTLRYTWTHWRTTVKILRAETLENHDGYHSKALAILRVMAQKNVTSSSSWLNGNHFQLWCYHRMGFWTIVDSAHLARLKDRRFCASAGPRFFKQSKSAHLRTNNASMYGGAPKG